MRRSALIFAFLLGPAGCGGQASHNYRGEPLATFHGTLVVDHPETFPATDIALLWPNFGRWGDESAGRSLYTATRVLVETELPARFTLTIVEPPPESAFFPPSPDPGQGKSTEAEILLARRGAQVTNASDTILATLMEYNVDYVDRDTDILVGATPDGAPVMSQMKKGFHLMQMNHMHCADGYDQSCIDRDMAAPWYWSEAMAREDCAINPQDIVRPVEVPVDTEIVWKVVDPHAWIPIVYTVPCP